MDDFQPERQWAEQPPRDDPAPYLQLAAAVVLQALADRDFEWFYSTVWHDAREFWCACAGLNVVAVQEKLAARRP